MFVGCNSEELKHNDSFSFWNNLKTINKKEKFFVRNFPFLGTLLVDFRIGTMYRINYRGIYVNFYLLLVEIVILFICFFISSRLLKLFEYRFY